jgi:eukaryotic-like serine/threonine-protein kinase
MPGSLFNGRFEIDRRAGAGGMSVVYRARDMITGETCALKLLTGDGAAFLERFDREGKVLAELHHPAIVRHIAHGVTAAGDRWLAMEWLEGEDLATRLARAPLTIAEVVVLARVAAEGLGVAHAHGVVHRDVKPSNLFLPGGRIDRVKVLDFGIARLPDDEGPARAGVRIGTPAYMSPEQARGLATVDARTDVFSLGCVLYQCLTGTKPFTGDDLMAVLAKILLDEPPAIERARSDAPPALSRLIARMLAKAPEARPHDGAAVAAEAVQIASDVVPRPRARRSAPTTSPPPVGPRRKTRTADQRAVSVVVAHDPDVARRPVELHAAVERAAPLAGLRVETLKDGTIVVVVGGGDEPRETVTRAARIALALRDASRGPVALATGRADPSVSVPVGAVIERATGLLRGAATGVRAVGVDEVSGGLLDARFEMAAGGEGRLELIGERAG